MTAVRTLLTVLVAAALIGASLPAVDEARADRTGARLDAAATRLSDTAAALVASDDPVPLGERGASRTVVVTLPHAGVADARAAYLSIGGLPNASAPSAVGYRVADRPPRQVDAGVTFRTGADPLVLAPGRHTLRLTLVRTATGVAVCVRPVSRRTGPATRSAVGR
ncbi:DUF7311 family protein [Salinigranum sp. GCM10025319]|uniref:DUF7311 family protein n=1 Tax=Salinigranum sp. GCM10025319 TaxID=3252687 RepID=UPI00361E4254